MLAEGEIEKTLLLCLVHLAALICSVKLNLTSSANNTIKAVYGSLEYI